MNYVELFLPVCSGKISYFTHVPEQHTLATHVRAEIVTQMSKEFDIDSLLQHDVETLKGTSEKYWNNSLYIFSLTVTSTCIVLISKLTPTCKWFHWTLDQLIRTSISNFTEGVRLYSHALHLETSNCNISTNIKPYRLQFSKMILWSVEICRIYLCDSIPTNMMKCNTYLSYAVNCSLINVKLIFFLNGMA